MNGRVYDYNLGRFLSVDPFIQDPGNSQSLNPYSYIMNNPLAGTDPSGYFSRGDSQTKTVISVNNSKADNIARDNGLFTNMNSSLANGAAISKVTNIQASATEIGGHASTTGSNGARASASVGAGSRQYASLNDSDILQDFFGNDPETTATEILVNETKQVIRKATHETIEAGKKAAANGLKKLQDVDLVPSRETAYMVGTIASGGLAIGSLSPCSAVCGTASVVIDALMALDHIGQGKAFDAFLTAIPGATGELVSRGLRAAIVIPDANTLKVMSSVGAASIIATTNTMADEDEND